MFWNPSRFISAPRLAVICKAYRQKQGVGAIYLAFLKQVVVALYLKFLCTKNNVNLFLTFWVF